MLKEVDYRQNILLALELLDNVRKDANGLDEKIRAKDEETQDILHIIENFNFSGVEGFHLAKHLKEVRRERRELKNKKELAESKEVKAIMSTFTNGGYKENPKKNLGQSTFLVKEM